MRKLQFLNYLWVRLALAFAVVAMIAIGVSVLISNLSFDREFRSFVTSNEIDLRNSGLVAQLTDYYTEHQGWDNVGTILAQFERPTGPDSQPGGPPPDRSRGRLMLSVA
ncbi:MAG TPA: hypothetical protein VFF59_00805, partial [Anaerolineae bacterium]|nr:hypothetical protein [Anaerolineae bacterium]